MIDQHRINHNRRAGWQPVAHPQGQSFGDNLDDLHPPQEAGLDGRRAIVAQHGVDLRGDKFRRQSVNTGHAGAVLGRHGGDGAHAVAAQGRPGLQVGLQPGRAAGVGAGDGKEGEGIRQMDSVRLHRHRFVPRSGLPTKRCDSLTYWRWQ